MNRVARSIFIFGIYLAVVGLLLMTIPGFVVGLFGFPQPQEPWVRVVGLVVFVLGYYYLQGARQDVMLFFRGTIWGRCLGLAGLILLVVGGQAAPALILFGVVDAAGAAWTALEIRGSRRTND
jgi:hypothetical protein